jgi:hypothetical protein
MVSVVPLNAVMLPSTKFVGVVVYEIRTLLPTVKAVAVEARFVVNESEPVPIVTELVLLRPE